MCVLWVINNTSFSLFFSDSLCGSCGGGGVVVVVVGIFFVEVWPGERLFS